MQKIADLGVVVVAGGSSRRYGDENKLFALLGGFPVFIHSLKSFAPLLKKGALVLVVPENGKDRFQQALKQYAPDIDVTFAPGGSTRPQSAVNGLEMLPDDIRISAVHDAARPLAGAELLKKLYDEVCRTSCGAIAAEKVVDSICRSDENGRISDSIDRELLWRIQTPQMFFHQQLLSAYRRFPDSAFTDDSALMRHAGYTVNVVENPCPNLKLTTRQDLPVLELFLGQGEMSKHQL